LLSLGLWTQNSYQTGGGAQADFFQKCAAAAAGPDNRRSSGLPGAGALATVVNVMLGLRRHGFIDAFGFVFVLPNRRSVPLSGGASQPTMTSNSDMRREQARRPAGQAGGSGNLAARKAFGVAADRAFPAAVAELDR
jgi:hypothetical protein